MSDSFDCLIVGGGPAGLATALAMGRANRTALVVDSQQYRNQGAPAMHTVLSRDGTPPGEFRRLSQAQIEAKYPLISFRAETVVAVAKTDDGGFTLTDSTGQVFRGRRLVLATGTEDIMPDLEGYAANWPEHIYQCLLCDGLEQKHRPIGVLAFDHPAYLHLSFMALQLNTDLTIFTNGPRSTDPAIAKGIATVLAVPGTRIDERRIVRLVNNGPGADAGVTVEFETGPSVTLGFLVHRPATRNRGQPLFDQLGLELTPGGEVKVDPVFLESSVKGCIVAGDTMDGIKQVAIAQGAGVRAGAVVGLQLTNEAIAKAQSTLTERR
ncbi:hypothetical protein ASPZODRAFT_133808 [Penicilliopsis zonata CBS 506.65]|uniref:FAD/NAD(P)-binding domain-containing protein n=1 Tax=Penicilliopsis zonata CBS 506.65 TaxID=1073090 RepID=A0A1L9SFK3_9EURO|nr:hypothetical protein ASPZODRAFT_133808 [Penicilliopsis zonata CBS 506.65]OJJ45942.1 hypothetical protein ASPZODRAFT_133808 [Penicilliopsis zonata CBS 506.65]